ncbi:hypothetical protein [Vagococcus silagei]|uniref:Oligopeptide transport permease C-like N-terminal domain-containing protein n=1 Tax=Vagococcus silagei TaxID=2508885 RepID=A0A4S3B3Y3_9ENTE|nr:hypothetical protein [Vagococcus silagei]THB60096.1 hypothetical protein ESZ54_12215 [Vagococcus silagei]
MEQNVEYLFSFADKQSRKKSKKVAESQSFKLTKLQLFFKNKTAVLSGLIIVLITCLAYGGLLFYRVDPNQQNLTIANQLPSLHQGTYLEQTNLGGTCWLVLYMAHVCHS